MSSEIITKNDLKAILDTALPTQPVLSDTGWIAPTFTSAFTDYSEDQPVLYRRIGKTVEIVGAAKPTAQLAAGSDTVAFTLPLGFRPSQPVNKIQQGTNYNIWFMYIATNGEVHVSRYRTGSTAEALTTTVWLNMPISFTVENEQWPVTPVTTADYVVEQGTDGIWTYRKWSSGISECWGVYTATLTNYASNIGSAGTLYGYKTESLSFPTGLFIEEPIPTFSAYVGAGFAMTGTITTAISASACTFYAVATASGSQSTKWYLRAEGKWK